VAAGGEPLRHLYAIRAGAVRLERAGQPLQVLEEGEVFGYTSLISRQAFLDVVVEDRLLAYRLPGAQFERLLGDARFAAHFAAGLAKRLQASLDRPRAPRFEPDVGVEVGQLVQRAAVWAGPEATVGDVARTMRDERVSSVLLRCDPPGIVTDRDLRSRVLGEDLGPELAASRVCSRPLRTVAAGAPLYEAWRTLLDAGVNHLPVVRDGEIVGVLTSTDLLRHSAHGPVAVLRRLERLASRGDVAGYGREVTEMASALLAAGLDTPVIAGFVAQLDAALLRRLLHLAEADLGPPPAPYAWLVFGSEGRREQALITEQLSALVYGDAGAGEAAWFRALAQRVEADLEVAGFPPPPAERAGRPRSGTLSEWTGRVERCLDERPEDSSMLLDLRPAAGTLDVDPMEAALAGLARDPRAVRALARQALALAPPAAPLLRLRGPSRVDLEREGILPLASLARWAAVEAGSRTRGTLERLDEAARAGVLSPATHAAAAESFRFLLRLRLSVRLEAAAAGEPGSDQVTLSDLSAIDRTRLKDALRAIRRWQEQAASRYRM